MSFIFRVYNIKDKELIQKTNEIRTKAEKIASISPGVSIFECSDLASCSYSRCRVWASIAVIIALFQLILSSLGREFNYDDISKRSMLSDTQQYKPFVSKVAMALNIPIYPSLDDLVKRYGAERFKDRIEDRLERYKVLNEHTAYE